MDNVGEMCISAFFSTPMEENMEVFNSKFDQEFKVRDEMEKRELFDSSYDDELYNHCAMIETQFNQPLHLGRGMKRKNNEEPKIIKKPRTEEASEMEKCELFHSSYDDELYNHCAMVETQFNQPLRLGRGMKRKNNEEPKIIKKPRTEEASASAGTRSGNEDQVECETCHIFVTKRNLVNHFRSKIHKNSLLNCHNFSVAEFRYF